jgi:hypothetical protein
MLFIASRVKLVENYMEYLVGAFHETFPQDSPPFLKKGKEL